MDIESESSGHAASDVSELDFDHEAGESKQEIARQETRYVLCFRTAVLVVLICSALGVALATYYFVSGSEQEQFEQKFRDDAHKILTSVGSTLDRTLGIFDSLSVTLVSSARASGDKWPFVTLPDFGIRLSKLLPLSRAIAISVLPLVTPDQRLEWEAYTMEHNSWVNESMQVQEKWSMYHGPVVYDWEPSRAIFGDFGDVPYNESRLFLPTWQNFPAIPTEFAPYNWDWFSDTLTESLLTCINTSEAVISDAYMIPTPNDPVAQAETEAWIPWFEQYIAQDEEPVEPVSNIIYPIIDDLSPDLGLGVNKPDGHQVVALLSADFYWREMLRNILPDDSQGIDVVFENPCASNAFTYRINGPNTEYIGVTDLHDSKYNALVVSKDLQELGAFSKEYSGVALSAKYCPFTLRVYPSDKMAALYTTNNRVIFTISAVMIFAFTSLVFWMYDMTVERRQAMVMRTATRSSAIVSSLFPVDVRDRLYDDGKNEPSPARVNKDQEPETTKGGVDFSSSPIANLYPQTTVFFADIVGFTSWSSQRQPTEVFRLLETLYYSFDVIAKQRGVFKVETIGDSYVAVVGLPNPREHHALVMVRFARDVRFKMAEVVTELNKSLGPGTADLALRIGLNSGSTTAGVLRGEKSRFQLFGDTVNTAARMESNGERNKIHVSQSTADQITASGKAHWLTPRSDKVNAKGKGLMQTYWCEPNVGAEGSVVPSHHLSDDPDPDDVGESEPTVVPLYSI